MVVALVVTAAMAAGPAGLAEVAASSPLLMADAAAMGRLHVRVVGLRSDAGVVKIGMYASGEAYTRRQGSFRKARLPVVNGASEWRLDGVPPGEYAVMFYHDRNTNDRLDRNALGLPKEPFGFSNNARPRLGPPSYERVKFPVSGSTTTIEILAQAR